MVFAEEDLLGERVRRQPVPAQVEICEERQVLKGPEGLKLHKTIVQLPSMQCTIVSTGNVPVGDLHNLVVPERNGIDRHWREHLDGRHLIV